ncbi:Nacht domain protein [Madurella fahalii]|uniref:Nacht domain protein n=1 Tax=Madurella fahalii TaxID=1157608 RepID=A0ABQ0G4U9_9PEZI
MGDPDSPTASPLEECIAAVEQPAEPCRPEKRDIATEAYAQALEYLKREFEGNTKATEWLRTVTSTTLHDLLETTQRAESKYNRVLLNKQGAKSWIRGLSRRILYYGQVLDVLSQHHPEYVSLVWGAVKFILMGIINHENLISQFSKALSWIAQALPRCELSAELYQTDEMKSAVASLYAHILLFLQQAIKWYNVGPAGRALTALFKPFELSYKETVDQIMLCAKTIDDISNLASKVDIRDIKILLQEESRRLAEHERKLHEMQVKFSLAHEELTAAVGAILRIVSCDNAKLGEIHSNVKDMMPRVIDMHFDQILGVLKPKRSPEDALRKHKSLIKRSSPWRSQNQDTVRILRSVGEWVLAPQSSSLILQTQPRAHTRVKEIATELIGQLCSKKVIWYLPSISIEEQSTVSTTEVLRSLVFQSLKQVPELVASQPNNFTTAKLHASHSEAEWLNLLCCTLRHLKTRFLVVDAEDVLKDAEQAEQLVGVFRELMDRFQDTETAIKLLVVNYSDALLGPGLLGGPRMKIQTVSREAPVPPRLRRPGARSIFRGAIWGDAAVRKSFVQR